MGRPDKLNLIPAFLDAMVTTPSIAPAARRVGLSADTVFRYLVRSRMGDDALQEIEWMGVVAPFHVHATQNVRALIAQSIQASAMDRALNGCEVDVFFQGVRQFEPVKKPEYADLSDADIEAFGLGGVAYDRKPTKQWLKPSDALTIKMLESWDKRYRPHQQVDVRFGGVLRLERPDERTIKTIEHTPEAFDDAADDTEQRGGHLALARPATSSEEMDRWAQQGEFKPAPVKFINAKGDETTLIAPERSDTPALRRQAAELSEHGPKNPLPLPAVVAIGKSGRAAPLDSAGTGRGHVPEGGFRVR